ncbi:MAG: hypothetical protein WAM14_12485 [Candidatus Nitrosopolaris sp.]
MEEADLPNGVLNITGSGDLLGQEIVGNERVAGIALVQRKKAVYEMIRRFSRPKRRPIIFYI